MTSPTKSYSFAVAVLLSLAASAPAQDSRGNPIRLQQDVKPAFHVTPVVHRFEARKGTVIPFEFELQSIRRTTTIQVRAVALVQDINGAIIPDTESEPPDNITLLTPAEINLADNETRSVRGRVRVPFTNSKFHSFGILVTDLGRIVGSRAVSQGGPDERRVGIRFITRYLLRCDISVLGAPGGDVTKLVLESGELVEEDGKARAQIVVSNPTDGPFEFELRARLDRHNQNVRLKSANLYMPVREALEPPERWTIRLLPNSSIRVHEFLPEAVFPGEYELQAEVVTNRRTRLKQSFPISIQAGDFPAQDATIVQVSRDITVAPAQVELSLRRRGKRFVPLELANNSQQTVNVSLTPAPFADGSLDWLTVRPQSLVLRPGTKRKVLVTYQPEANVESHQYGFIRVNAAPQEGMAIGEFDVPVTLLSRSDESPQIETEQLAWDGNPTAPGFVLEVHNRGRMHLPIEAKLTLTTAFSRKVELQAGFGRWLLPGQSTQLHFRTRFAPPSGDYQYTIQIPLPDGSEHSASDMVRVE